MMQHVIKRNHEYSALLAFFRTIPGTQSDDLISLFVCDDPQMGFQYLQMQRGNTTGRENLSLYLYLVKSSRYEPQREVKHDDAIQ